MLGQTQSTLVAFSFIWGSEESQEVRRRVDMEIIFVTWACTVCDVDAAVDCAV